MTCTGVWTSSRCSLRRWASVTSVRKMPDCVSLLEQSISMDFASSPLCWSPLASTSDTISRKPHSSLFSTVSSTQSVLIHPRATRSSGLRTTS